ncbi:endonuclease/exonuclease/phosphatase family protein [Flavobacterium sp. UBA6046]|jgi:endonuclease/exonuclease/phosphatase family metal-dependent hydrolase|uniref:endonuclease/exonuclease/phosphatase family protein n=1 Tax=Flavobacterium sp. UBA6046 TaxID=1946552 RepID=UPI0025BF8DD6|nr:endonuclease/exonuclease/phosphatase family protein [Flavobacterium sp. UBA6046]
MELKKSILKIDRSFLYINFIFAALLLFSYLSAVISPQKFWPLAFLGLSYSILLFINLAFCIYWAIRFKKYFFVSAISISVGFNVLLNSVEFNNSPSTISISSTPHLKLMTYNVHNFRTLDTPRNSGAYKPILKLIDLNQPDIIGIEEYNTSQFRFKICDSLKKVLNTSQFYFAPFITTKSDSTGLALFSKYPIIHRGVIGISNQSDDNQAIYIDIKYRSRIIRIYDFHLHSLEFEAQDYFFLNNFYHRRAISWFELKRIISKLKQGFIIRGQQVDIIRQHAAKCPYPYVFMGDLNDTPNSYTFNQMAMGMKNAFKEKGTGVGKTFNGGFASFQIDYILVSPQFHVFDYHIIHKMISDHYPVCSDVVLN